MYLRYGYSSAGILGGHKVRGAIRGVRVLHLEPLAQEQALRASSSVYTQCKILAETVRESARIRREARRDEAAHR